MRLTKEQQDDLYVQKMMRLIKQRTPLFRWRKCFRCNELVKYEPMSYLSRKTYMKTSGVHSYGYVCRTCAPTKFDVVRFYMNI